MSKKPGLERKWAPIRTESTSERLVFWPADSPDVPATRGIKHLDLQAKGAVVVAGPDAADRPLRESPGAWAQTGREITIDAPEWAGTYVIEKLSDKELILRRK